MSTVECPICGESVLSLQINKHIDSNCNLSVLSERNSPGITSNKHPFFTPKQNTTSTSPISDGPNKLKRKLENYVDNSNPSVSVNNEPSPKNNNNATKLKLSYTPLSEIARPNTMDEVLGQTNVIGEKSILRELVGQKRIPSIVLWGPPGSGKTTIGRIIAKSQKTFYKEISAVTHTIADVRKFGEDSRNHFRLTSQKPILFVDEIHRFTKSQQDIFLPLVESGVFTLITATTENPSFRITPALLSRCKVFILQKLEPTDLYNILHRAATLKLNPLKISLEIHDDANPNTQPEPHKLAKTIRINSQVLHILSRMSDGDARIAVNSLEMVVDFAIAKISSGESLMEVTEDNIKEALQKTHLMHDEEEHYNLISALHKSVRGSDENAALYWLGRMVYAGDDPLYLARRLIRMASEDIGLADSNALTLAVSTYEACRNVGMPECDVILAHCVTYLARAPKSVEVYRAMKRVKQRIENDIAYPVPLHIRNAPTKLMEETGYGEGYIYNPNYDEPVEQTYLPTQLQSVKFFGKAYGPEDQDI
ncbi:Werner helicase interacting protein 1 [Nowakowskiella sp. JEL0407]|nr:Werner helicase interacting protein 1 [Nowakowskiella sp. JEL0407]